MLEQAYTQLCRGSSFAQRQIQRMQVPRPHINEPSDIAIRAHHTAHLIRLQQAEFVTIAQTSQLFGFLGKALKVTRLVGQVTIAPRQVTRDIETLDTLANDFHRLQPHQFHVPHTVFADDAFKLFEAMTDTANQLPAITPAGPPADLVRFEQHHAHATLGQLQCCVQAREATPDHAHIRHMLALQHRMVGLRQAAGGIVRGGVLAALNRGVHVRNPDICVWKILRSISRAIPKEQEQPDGAV